MRSSISAKGTSSEISVMFLRKRHLSKTLIGSAVLALGYIWTLVCLSVLQCCAVLGWNQLTLVLHAIIVTDFPRNDSK